ncbi:hypothetical protein NP590_09840 [Methylomonas sp. SURF-2]|uniref:Uncharacterized protein n=1 Tax=Methylomonas subterranea TaxID=2952225 RepID=A0ABT1TGM9_9GAMM|nr:hypothetical protein [Methylomonas sp. SURF-2]MCQ8104403.1 hypothetical protein [Methylomonas sp. SURF-2]
MAVVNVSVLDDRTDQSRINKRCEWIRNSGTSEFRIVVNESTLLDKFFTDLKKRLGDDNKIGTLTILCHGFGRYQYPDEERKKSPKIRGGFGLEFCKEGVTLANAHLFTELKGAFEPEKAAIMIVGCGAAVEETFNVVPSGKEKASSFGRKMCIAIAKASGALVVASTSFQDIDVNEVTYLKRERGVPVEKTEKCLDPGRWEGKVWAFAPNGTVKPFFP